MGDPSASQNSSSFCRVNLSVAVIAPDETRRVAIAKVIATTQARLARECSEYPDPEALARLTDAGYEVIVVDLDAGVDKGLGVIESICKRDGLASVVACSSGNEADLIIRAMRAGAREFLTGPLNTSTLLDAFGRASSRRQTTATDRALGKLIIFEGAKGGIGATMLATNFAVALMQQSCGDVVLVDLHPQLGEVALGLGLTPRYSLVDALSNAGRLDCDFLSTLLTRHDSGLRILASADTHGEGANRSLERGAEKLFRILREQFSFVVVDAGPTTGHTPDALFEIADVIYLVTESSLPALRNARRMISYLVEKKYDRGLEIVFNRSNSRMVEIDEESATKALARLPDWKVPNDYMAVRGAQNLGIPLVRQDTPVSRVICEMAKVACGKSASPRDHRSQAVLKGEKWKFWTSNATRQLSTARS